MSLEHPYLGGLEGGGSVGVASFLDGISGPSAVSHIHLMILLPWSLFFSQIPEPWLEAFFSLLQMWSQVCP